MRALSEAIASVEDFNALVSVPDSNDKTKYGHAPKCSSALLAACGVCGAPLRSCLSHCEPAYRCASHDGFGRKREGRHVSIAAFHLDGVMRNAVISGLLVALSCAVPEPETEQIATLRTRFA